MSHTSKLQTDIKSKSAIKKAAKECGVEVTEDAATRMYYRNQHGNCDLVLKLKGKYDVGLEKQADGTYSLVYDSHAGYVGAELGNNIKGGNPTLGKFLQSYAKHAAIEAATRKGYSVAGTTTDKQGNIHLQLNLPGA